MARKVAVEPDNGDARKLLIVGVLGNVPVDMRAWLTPKQGASGRGGYRNQPEQQECDANHDFCEHAATASRADSTSGRDDWLDGPALQSRK